MGRLFILVIFVICFIIFSIVKLFFDGTKAAYKAVFTPEDEEREREQRVVKNCIKKIIEFMQKNYNGNTEEIPYFLSKFVPIVQKFFLDNGYKITPEIAKDIACEAIVQGEFATREQVYFFAEYKSDKNTKFLFDEDPIIKNENTDEDTKNKLITNCMEKIALSLQKDYDGNLQNLHYFIIKHIHLVEDTFKEKGFGISKKKAMDIVKVAIVNTKYATHEEIDKIIKRHEEIEEFKSEYARHFNNKFETNNFLHEETVKKKEILATCMTHIASVAKKNYTGNLQDLVNIIVKLTPDVQTFVSKNGYEVNSGVTTNIICRTIIYANIASPEEVQSAQQLIF